MSQLGNLLKIQITRAHPGDSFRKLSEPKNLYICWMIQILLVQPIRDGTCSPLARTCTLQSGRQGLWWSSCPICPAHSSSSCLYTLYPSNTEIHPTSFHEQAPGLTLLCPSRMCSHLCLASTYLFIRCQLKSFLCHDSSPTSPSWPKNSISFSSAHPLVSTCLQHSSLLISL